MSSATRNGTAATGAGKASTTATSKGHRQREVRRVSVEIAELEARVTRLTNMIAALDGERARVLMQIHMLRTSP